MSESIWAIEQGSYSDYRVVGVYTTEAKAKRVAETINGSDVFYEKATVAEWPLDPGFDAINQGLSQYSVLMRKNGDVETVTRRDGVSGYEIADTYEVWRRSRAPAHAASGKPDVLNATVWASSGEHATKIVSERLMQMLATGAWDLTA